MRASLTIGIATLGLAALGLAGLPTTTNAQCWSCPGTPGQDNFHCASAAAGSWDCTQEYPGAPCMGHAGCSGGGGGGGGGCDGEGLNFMSSQPQGKTVATSALLFKSQASLNAHVFGGRGHAVRVVPGVAFDDLTAEGAVGAIAALDAQAAGVLKLAHAYTNMNNGGAALNWMTGPGDGYVFAAVSEASGTHLGLRAKQGRQRVGDLIDKRVSDSDLVLVDLQINGQAYVLAMKLQSLDQAAPDFLVRVHRIQNSMKQSVEKSRDFEKLDIMIIPC